MNKHAIYNIGIHIHRTHVLHTSHTTKHTHHTSWLLTEHRHLKSMWAHSLHVDALVMSNKPCWNLPDDVVREGLWTSQQPVQRTWVEQGKEGGSGSFLPPHTSLSDFHRQCWTWKSVERIAMWQDGQVPRVTVCGCSRVQKEILSARDRPLLPGLGLT